MRTILRGMFPFAVAVALVLPGTPASATKPEVKVHIDEGMFTLDGLITCGGVVLEEELLSERVTFTTYFDRAGEPLRMVIHANFFGILKNPVTEATLRDHAVFTETEDFVDGAVTVSGQSFHYIEKGSGQVFAEVGRKIIVLEDGTIAFQAGQDDYELSGDEGICDLLS